jgi:hypothetical protein
MDLHIRKFLSKKFLSKDGWGLRLDFSEISRKFGLGLGFCSTGLGSGFYFSENFNEKKKKMKEAVTG